MKPCQDNHICKTASLCLVPPVWPGPVALALLISIQVGLIALAAPEASVEVRTHMIRADQHRRAMEFEPAVEEYNQAVKLDPKYYPAYVARGKLKAQYGLFDQAVADNTLAIKYCQDKASLANLYRVRGRLYTRMGKDNLALADMSKSLQLSPGEPGASYNRSHIYLHMGQLDKALADLQNAVKGDPQILPYRQELGDLLLKKENYKQAVDAFTECIKLDPELPGGYQGRARAYDALNMHDKAGLDYARAKKIMADP